MPIPPWHPDSLAARMPFLRRRALLTQATRAFFTARGYTEVETAYAVPTPGEEVHLRPWRTRQHAPDGTPRDLFLHTSPEFAMKRLLVAGAGPIFQLARVWRDGEAGRHHLGEFTMLEWYRPGLDFAGLIAETEAFLRAVLPPKFWADGIEHLTLAEAFHRHLGLDLLATADDPHALATAANTKLRPNETWEDLFFRLLLEHIDPHLGRPRPTILTHFPAQQAALARRDPADPRVALRFELFIDGIELANAFEELTDPQEQTARFQADRTRRTQIYGPTPMWPLDTDLLAALHHGMPQSAGIALGFDRLTMLAAGATRIDQVLWMPLA
ncbi:MAG: EF-P lysine aminoacylase EpmA [Acetobacteraceae bacterium]